MSALVDVALLRRIDAYLDAVPRSAARAEYVGPFTLFVNDGPGWRYYARPTPRAEAFTPADVAAVRERQRALEQPEAIEWVADLAPGVGPAAAGAGLAVLQHPLMHLPAGAYRPAAAPAGARVTLASHRDDLATLTAVAMVAFATPGTGAPEIDPGALAAAARDTDDDTITFARDRMERGMTVTAVARVGGTPVAVGSHQPVGGATEIVGVATLPAFRRRGLGGALTTILIEDAFGRGVDTVFLSAGDEDVARMYARLGFRRVGRVGAAEPEGK